MKKFFGEGGNVSACMLIEHCSRIDIVATLTVWPKYISTNHYPQSSLFQYFQNSLFVSFTPWKGVHFILKPQMVLFSDLVTEIAIPRNILWPHCTTFYCSLIQWTHQTTEGKTERKGISKKIKTISHVRLHRLSTTKAIVPKKSTPNQKSSILAIYIKNNMHNILLWLLAVPCGREIVCRLH